MAEDGTLVCVWDGPIAHVFDIDFETASLVDHCRDCRAGITAMDARS